MKAKSADLVKKFTDIPNIGPAMTEDFVLLGLKSPHDPVKQDAFELYKILCKKTKFRHDPCVLDAFLAAIDFMNGAPPRAWWKYTDERKKKYHI